LTSAGIILQEQGKNREARDRFAQALDIDPDAAVAANNLAWLYAETDEDLDRALELALRAKAALPDRPEVNNTVGWVYYRKGLASDAIPYFAKSIEKDATNPVYHYYLGLAYLKNGDPARGRRSLEHALTLKPDFSNAADARRTLASLAP
jgi:Tfp pilus assembly protein PilF